MTNYQIYTLILCGIVFVLLTSLSIFVIKVIYKLTVKLIKNGAEDEKIKAEFTKKKKTSRLSRAIDATVLLVLCLILGFFFSSSIYISCTQNTYFENVPTYRVVKTDSMSKKNEKNQYLFENNLNNQIQAFDLIAMYKLPAEEDLQLYDIVIYEVDDMLIVHRIVEIEEPNESHPNQRYFRLQGDAISSPDRFPVSYSQMRGIYKGQRIPFVGSFVLFMQSPAGYLCVLLVAVAIIATPILDKKLIKHRHARFSAIQGDNENNYQVNKEQAISNANAKMGTETTQTTNVNVYDIFSSSKSQFDGKYFYTDATGIKIYSSHPIHVDKYNGKVNAEDIIKLDTSAGNDK